MAVSIQVIILEIVLLIVIWFVEHLFLRIFFPTKKVKHLWWVWTIILWLLIIFNLGYYWPAYPIAVWMVLALALIALQIAHNHEFIYRRYWPVFWRYSAYYALLIYIGSMIISRWLPLG
ncbi:hypothetical protein H5S09_04395 [Limosilactobacillus sp. STM2_1]|uniref:DUF3397 domain-containing protein n=1 Tax=Limosilactobacillus rudii TaxID=2759755 RepID=A0A7W3YN63_9LACO|nr:hypothetical protein [Limosilactobacillus rudii]MBB1078531.1 hypothetical protein [Limosilactobacillus rudii]MBB1097171.1 hypothetical protein [Limosilactobacillus rudii]MCD7133913.1 hypothetical protein [Limosilactobacillus rudii]